jgi:hypothetical protein
MVSAIYLLCEFNSAAERMDVAQPSSVTAEYDFNCLNDRSDFHCFGKEYLSQNLISFCSNDASTMLDRISSVSQK